MKPMMKPPGTKHLKLKCDILLSTCAFKFNLRRYPEGDVVATLAAGAIIGEIALFEAGSSQHIVYRCSPRHPPHFRPPVLEVDVMLCQVVFDGPLLEGGVRQATIVSARDDTLVGAFTFEDLAGGLLRTNTRPTLNRPTESARLYEHSP